MTFELVVWLFVVALFVACVVYIIDLLTLPPNAKAIAKVIVGLLALMIIFRRVLPALGGPVIF